MLFQKTTCVCFIMIILAISSDLSFYFVDFVSFMLGQNLFKQTHVLALIERHFLCSTYIMINYFVTVSKITSDGYYITCSSLHCV